MKSGPCLPQQRVAPAGSSTESLCTAKRPSAAKKYKIKKKKNPKYIYDKNLIIWKDVENAFSANFLLLW